MTKTFSELLSEVGDDSTKGALKSLHENLESKHEDLVTKHEDLVTKQNLLESKFKVQALRLLGNLLLGGKFLVIIAIFTVVWISYNWIGPLIEPALKQGESAISDTVAIWRVALVGSFFAGVAISAIIAIASTLRGD